MICQLHHARSSFYILLGLGCVWTFFLCLYLTSGQHHRYISDVQQEVRQYLDSNIQEGRSIIRQMFASSIQAPARGNDVGASSIEMVIEEHNGTDVVVNASSDQQIHVNRKFRRPLPTEKPWVPPKLPNSFWLMNKTRVEYVYHHDPADVCAGQIDLLVVVFTALGNRVTRIWIRQTWKKKITFNHLKIRLVFLLGEPSNKSKLTQRRIDKEAMTYRDIVQGDFYDTYRNLTYKTMMGLQWASTRCSTLVNSTHFGMHVMKMDDDDLFISQRINIFLHHMTSNSSNRTNTTNTVYCTGGLSLKRSPNRNPKFKWLSTVQDYPEETHASFCLGSMGYSMHSSVAGQIYQSFRRTRFYWLEDVFTTGVLRQRLGVPIKDIEVNITIPKLAKKTAQHKETMKQREQQKQQQPSYVYLYVLVVVGWIWAFFLCSYVNKPLPQQSRGNTIDMDTTLNIGTSTLRQLHVITQGRKFKKRTYKKQEQYG